MRNRNPQPAPLDLPPVNITPIRIYGQLIGPMQRPEASVKILLKAITTNQLIVQDTWSECTVDQAGHYDFSVNPGKYAVYFERSGLKTRVNNIQVYSDSAPGPLQTFMLSPAPEMLTPLVVQESKAILEMNSAAMLRSRQWAENPVDVPVLDFEQGAGPEYSAYHWAHKAMESLDTDTNINWRKEWSSTTAYAFRDAVRYQGSAYYCIEANTGIVPPTADIADNANWSLMARKGDNSTVQGPPGPSNTLTIGTVTAVPYGTNPTVTLSGTSPGQILNFTLETGKEGNPGTPADMSDYYNKTEVTNLINADLANYYTKTQIDAMFAGGGVVPSGAVGMWALLTAENMEQFTYGESVPGSKLNFASIYSEESGELGVSYTSSTRPAGTWRMAATSGGGAWAWGTAFIAQRIA